jgi:hypothetical protein
LYIYFILKRTAAILLSGILLFNWIGYQFLNDFLQNKSEAQLDFRLDNANYDESQLISIKVPATNFSYYTNSKSFERVDGKVEINGVSYKFVKRRLYNDSLELLCIPDYTTMKLQTAKDDFFKTVNDLQHNAQNKKADSHSNFSKNFSIDNYTLSDIFKLADNDAGVAKISASSSSSFTSFCSPVDGQPPEIF